MNYNHEKEVRRLMKKTKETHAEQMQVFERYVSENWQYFARIEDFISDYTDTKDKERYDRLQDMLEGMEEATPYTLSIGLQGYVISSQERVFLYVSPYAVLYIDTAGAVESLYLRKTAEGLDKDYHEVLNYVYESKGLTKEERYILTMVCQILHSSFNLSTPYRPKAEYHAKLNPEYDGEFTWQPNHHRTVRNGQRYEIYDTEQIRFILQSEGFYDCKQNRYITTTETSVEQWFSDILTEWNLYRLKEQQLYHDLYHYYRKPTKWEKFLQRKRGERR